MVKRQNPTRAYSVGQPTVDISPEPINADRDPRTTDFAQIGTMWLNTTTNASFVITSIKNNQATWRGTGQTIGNNIKIIPGEGDPDVDNVEASVGTLFIRLDPQDDISRMYINVDGGTTWAHFNTAS